MSASSYHRAAALPKSGPRREQGAGSSSGLRGGWCDGSVSRVVGGEAPHAKATRALADEVGGSGRAPADVPVDDARVEADGEARFNMPRSQD